MQQCRAGLLVPAAAEKDALEGETQRRIVGLHPSEVGVFSGGNTRGTGAKNTD